MRTFAHVGGALAVGALAVAAPAALAQGHPTHPTQPAHPAHPAKTAHPGQSHKCVAHGIAYRASGTLVTFTATSAGTGGYTGTITVDVRHGNHHARGAKGSVVTYTLTGARVKIAHKAGTPTAGDPVTIIGKVTAVAKKCTGQSAAGTVTVRQVGIGAPHISKTASPAVPA